MQGLVRGKTEVRPPQVAGRRRFDGKVTVVIYGFIHYGLGNDKNKYIYLFTDFAFD